MAAAADYKITKRRDGRYMVMGPGRKPVNGLEKAKILLEKGLIKTGLPKDPEPEAPAEEASAEGEAAAEEAPAES